MRGTSRCAPGAFSLTAPVFRSPRAQKGAWCARDSTWAHGPGAHGESTIFRRARRQPHQPHHQQQKPHTNHITNAKNHAPIKPATPATPHQRHTSRINSTSNKSHTPTTSPTPETMRRLHQRFLYCDGETPNISLKYFAKYFCVPKPTASETSTTLSPASADNSLAALLSRMVRMNTEGFIP